MVRLKTVLLAAALAMGGVAPIAAASEKSEIAAAPYVRPDVQNFLKLMQSRPRPPMSDESVKQMRKIPPEMMAQMMSAIEAPLGTLAVDKQLTIPGPGGPMELRLFDARAERAAGPVLVFYHGGGFITGGIATHAPLAAEMARQLDIPVVSVEYRLAPEHKFPAAPDDAEAAARWIADNGAALGREVNGLILSGDSAGGTLTLVTALALRDKPARVPLRMMIPLYPMTDATKVYPSTKAYSDGYGLSTKDMTYYGKAYAADAKNPRHTTLYRDLTGLPPTVLVTASLDPLRDGGRAFAAKLIQSGVPVSYYEAQGNIHGFATYRRGIPSAQGDLDKVLAMAKAMLEKVSSKP